MLSVNLVGLSDPVDEFCDFIERQEFPCVGAKSALSRNQSAFWRGSDFLSDENDDSLIGELYAFIERYRRDPAVFSTFVAIYDRPFGMTEKVFEQALWRRLSALSRADAKRFGWDDRVSNDPSSPLFGFSLMSEAFFVVGMHSGASRAARRFGFPTLVFNLHDQFEKLRAEGRFGSLQAAIRKRDAAFDGAPNPMLAGYGEDSEARQYSGRPVGREWRCPFAPVDRKDAA